MQISSFPELVSGSRSANWPHVRAAHRREAGQALYRSECVLVHGRCFASEALHPVLFLACDGLMDEDRACAGEEMVSV
jgi:hypothetical protein